MTTQDNKFGIHIPAGSTVLIGGITTVAEHGKVGLALRGSVFCSFLTIADDASANMNGPSGTNINASQESALTCTGYDASDKIIEIFDDSIDSGVIKIKARETSGGKTIMIADASASDTFISGGAANVLNGTVTCGGALYIGLNGEEANTSLDVSSSNYSIHGGQGINLYNGGQLFARAANIFAGANTSDPWAGEKSSRWGLYLANGDIGGTSTSNAPTGTWYCSSLRNTTSGNILRMTSGVCHITGENTGSNRFVEITDGNIYHSNGTISIETDSAAEFQWDAVSTDQDNGPYNLIINHASNTTRIRTHLEVLRDLTVTEGTFNTHSNDGGADKNLTVTRNLIVNSASGGAGLSINDSVVSCAKIQVESGDTITAAHSSNELTVTGAAKGAERTIDFTGIISGTLDIICTHANTAEQDLSASSGFINLLTINHASHLCKMNSTATLTNLTITAGHFATDDGYGAAGTGTDKVFTVTGTCDVSGSFTGNASAVTFGALVINSGGVFSASSATTTIGNAGPSTPVGVRNMYVHASSTFTHNNGLLKFTGANNVCLSNVPSAGNGHRYYDIEVDASGTVTYTDVQNDRPFYIENDLTIASGSTFQNQGGDDIFQCDGTIYCNGTLNTSSTTSGGAGNFTFNNLELPTGGTYNATDGTTTITGAYRNTGGTFTAN